MNKNIKVIIVLILVLTCITATYYFHFQFKTDIVFTHMFYIPIVISSIWWKRTGIGIAVFLGLFTLVSQYFSDLEIHYEEIIRSAMFIVVSIIITYVLSKYRNNIVRLIEQNKISSAAVELMAHYEELSKINKDLQKEKETIKENEILLKIRNEEYLATNEELRQTNEELYRAKEKAEVSSNLKTAFLQNISHEIRTPMNGIIGFSNLLNNPELSEEKRKNFTNIIINSSNQLLSIVTDILTMSSIETQQEKVNISRVNVNSVVVDLLSIFKLQADDKGLSIHLTNQNLDQRFDIYTDLTKVTQILTNLLNNAIKFTHQGNIEFGYKLNGNYVEFYVKDSGIGIKSDFNEKIFDRFRQVENGQSRLYRGTGLGLSISKGFIELLDGKIWVESQEGKGSTFYFTIPYKPACEIDETHLPTTNNGGLLTILVAEDEENNYLFLQELLLNMNFKLIHSKDGSETVEICKNNPNIKLILMDIKMPIMDGYSAAKKIREFRHDIPIIAQSAYLQNNEREIHNESVFNDFISKPINENELKLKLRKFLVNI